MLNKMNEKELQKEIHRLQKLQQIESIKANETRAQSIAIGTSGGGTTEITMRGVNGTFLWNAYQPVEIIELIHQLSANIGCHLHLIPRQDFGSWRDWKVSPEELAHARGIQHLPGVGFPPFVNDMSDHTQTGRPIPVEQEVQEKENVATKKAVNKRTIKRSRTSTK